MAAWSDLADRLNGAVLGQFGEVVTLSPNCPAQRAICAVFDETWQETDPETGVGIASTLPRIRARVADLAGVKPGDRLMARGRVWVLDSLAPAGGGFQAGNLSR